MNHPTAVKKKGKYTWEPIPVTKELLGISPLPKQEGKPTKMEEGDVFIYIHGKLLSFPIWEPTNFIASELSKAHQQGYAEGKQSERDFCIDLIKENIIPDESVLAETDESKLVRTYANYRFQQVIDTLTKETDK